MALLGKFDQNYTKTGGNWFSRMSGYASYIPIAGAPIAAFMGTIGTVIETLGWLVRGKFASAATAAATGTAATAVNTVGGAGLAWGSMILTGRSLGTHARKLTEAGVGAVTGAVNLKPQVLSSYPVGIGGIGGVAPAAPGRFATQIANERGQNSQQMYNNYLRGEGGVHVNELASANGRGM